MALLAFHTDFGDFELDDSAPFAYVRFPPETFFTMTRTLAKAFDAVVAAGFTTCILDMSRVTYLDSAAISAMLMFDTRLQSHGGWARVVNGSEHRAHLTRLFDMLGLRKRFPIYVSIEEALAAPELR